MKIGDPLLLFYKIMNILFFVHFALLYISFMYFNHILEDLVFNILSMQSTKLARIRLVRSAACPTIRGIREEYRILDAKRPTTT